MIPLSEISVKKRAQTHTTTKETRENRIATTRAKIEEKKEEKKRVGHSRPHSI